MRRFTALAVAVLVALPAGACASSGSTVPAAWREVPAGSLVPDPSSRPFAATVSAGGDGRPALIGGVILGGPSAPQGFFPADSRQVALWVAPSLSGPWKLARLDAIAGRDGPNETLMFASQAGPTDAVFGWRNSPTEGYPRPSGWLAAGPDDRTWTEVLEPREFFGGPSIVGYGGMSAGAHGYFIAGTWTVRQGQPAVAVWHSPDGSHWVRDTGSPGFDGDTGELPFGEGVADGSHGVLLIGNLEVPSQHDPGAQAGAMWFSPDGNRWDHLFTDPSRASTFDAVTATSAGWVVAGSVGSSARRLPAVWFVPADLRREPPVELTLGSPAQPVRITGVSANPTHVVVAGLAGGTAVLWAARLNHGVPGAWTRLSPPPATEPGLERVVVSTGRGGTIVALVGSVDARVWTTAWS